MIRRWLVISACAVAVLWCTVVGFIVAALALVNLTALTSTPRVLAISAAAVLGAKLACSIIRSLPESI